ncbi:MAG: ATP-binding protein [Dehalococcoidia bacterium]|nr:ATP-binding protein [Dehalococcoidia bacterium]
MEFDVSGESVVAIFGKRGSGKSYTLGVLAEALCTLQPISDIGTCSRQKGVLLLDTLNVFWSTENPLSTETDRKRFPVETSRMNSWHLRPTALDVEVWIPKGFRSPHTPDHYSDFAIPTSELTSDDLADLFDIDSQRDLIGQLLAEVREKTSALTSEFSFGDMVGVLEADDEIRNYYAEATIRAARQRLRSMSQVPLFASTGGTPLRDLLRPGRLSVLELGEVPNSLRTVVTSVLLRRIHSERARASDAEKQLALNTRLSTEERGRLKQYLEGALPPSWVMVDEAQNILPADRAVKSSDAVVRFVREGRNFGLSFALTTQQPAAVDARILAQTDTVICHKLTVANDIARMRDNMKCPEPLEVKAGGRELDLAAWLRSLDLGHAVVTNADSERLFALELRPRICPHGGTGFRPQVTVDG